MINIFIIHHRGLDNSAPEIRDITNRSPDLLLLNLSHNNLTELPSSFQELSNLISLDLRKNNFSNVK